MTWRLNSTRRYKFLIFHCNGSFLSCYQMSWQKAFRAPKSILQCAFIQRAELYVHSSMDQSGAAQTTVVNVGLGKIGCTLSVRGHVQQQNVRCTLSTVYSAVGIALHWDGTHTELTVYVKQHARLSSHSLTLSLFLSLSLSFSLFLSVSFSFSLSLYFVSKGSTTLLLISQQVDCGQTHPVACEIYPSALTECPTKLTQKGGEKSTMKTIFIYISRFLTGPVFG